MSTSRIHRLLRLITMLQSGRGFTADQLSNELEISRRTVFRDLNMLELAHIPYYFDDQRQSYRIGEDFFLPPVNLTLSEALAMLMLTGRLHEGSGLPLLSEGSRAAMKLESALPGAVREHVGSIIDKIGFSLGPVSRHEGLDAMFNEITQAIAAKRICRMVYISFFERKQIRLEVHPLRVIFQGRAWYLLAYSPSHRAVRTFKLGRIRKLTVSEKTFTCEVPIDADSHFDGAWSMIPEGEFHDIHLRFDPKVAANVAEVRWHPTQRIEWNADGSMEFFVRVNGLGEITWWILGYGDLAEVVAPAQLRQRMAEVSGRLLDKYSRPPSAPGRLAAAKGGSK